MNKKFFYEKKELIDLLNQWDPIGIMSLEAPKDEYDCFVNPILSILHKGKGKSELTNFLKKHLEDHMGLDSKDSKPDEFAEKIMSWWKSL